MNFFFATLFGFFLAVQASPRFAPRATLDSDVWNPFLKFFFITPNSDTVWYPGKTANVTWAQGTDNNAPDRFGNSNDAFITLNGPDDSTVLLADDIDIRSGFHIVAVPADITPDQYYCITLAMFGGNPKNTHPSEIFKIETCPDSDS